VFDLVDVFDVWRPRGKAGNQYYSYMNREVDREYRVSLVDSALVTSLGRLARNAPKQLIVRGIYRELAH
jgi:hypothetical protein